MMKKATGLKRSGSTENWLHWRNKSNLFKKDFFQNRS